MEKNSNIIYYLLVYVSAIFISFGQLSAQLQVSTATSPQQLVQNVLVGGGVTVSNVTYNGSNLAIGSFTNGNTTNLGLTSGIILATGRVNDAAGHVSVTPSTGFGLGGDPQLQNLISQQVYDASILRFDFIPIADTLRFRYVFGSDEYPEYVNSYNDVFGFFITGPNPAGGVYSNKNIALIPGTSLPVTINNVNNVNPSYPQYYVDNQSMGGTTITYDGFTTVLTAWVLVVPCVQYHIKIAIGDAGDDILDSGVFLEANSFSSNAVNFSTAYSSNIDTVAVEGCNDAIITFHLPNASPTQQVINFTIGGTAINGVDYVAIPDSVVIPAGQTSGTITISPLSDGIAEPTESVFLIFQSNPCGNDTVKIYIKDYVTLSGSVTSPVICGTGNDVISFNASNGFPPISYSWSNSATTSSVTVSPINTSNYTVTVADACGISIIDSVLVDIISAGESYTDVLCFGDNTGAASVNVSDGTAPFQYLWSTTPQQNNNTATGLIAGSYNVTITDAHGCTLIIPFNISQPSQLTLSLNNQDETCFNSCNGLSSTTVSGGISPYTYLWSTTPQQSTPDAISLCNGNYNITVTDSNNCSVSALFDINTNTLISADFLASPTSGLVPLNVDFTYTGNGASTWQWNFGDGNTSTISNPSNIFTEMGIYNVVLVANSGAPDFCTHTFSLLIDVLLPSEINIPNVFTPNGDGSNDLFFVENKGLETAEMKIFNRWGKLVAEWNNPQGNWDGNLNSGAQASAGVYYFIYTAKGYDKQEYNISGTINLLR